MQFFHLLYTMPRPEKSECMFARGFSFHISFCYYSICMSPVTPCVRNTAVHVTSACMFLAFLVLYVCPGPVSRFLPDVAKRSISPLPCCEMLFIPIPQTPLCWVKTKTFPLEMKAALTASHATAVRGSPKDPAVGGAGTFSQPLELAGASSC